LTDVSCVVAHEIGHWTAAKKVGAELQPPFLVPAGLGIIGTFGAITGVALTNRAAALPCSTSARGRLTRCFESLVYPKPASIRLSIVAPFV
jgi:Zn-dependent protease